MADDKLLTVNSLFDELADDVRDWGLYAEKIVAAYLELICEEQAKFRDTSSETKGAALFHQYAGEVRRSAKQLKVAAIPGLLASMFVILAIDGYRYDYRQTILALKSAIDAAKICAADAEIVEIWRSSKHYCSKATVERTENQFSIGYPQLGVASD